MALFWLIVFIWVLCGVSFVTSDICRHYYSGQNTELEDVPEILLGFVIAPIIWLVKLLDTLNKVWIKNKNYTLIKAKSYKVEETK